MSFCRITGKSRGLPKPNYFPLLPPISPGDAKRYCRITGKSYGLPSHNFIPVILTNSFSNKIQCKITTHSAPTSAHEQEAIYGRREHILLSDYRYIFPKFDESNGTQKVLLDLLDSKVISEGNYVYKVDERCCNLVFPAKLEAAVRDGDVRDVMLAKDSDRILLKMRQGKNVSVEMCDLNTADEKWSNLFDGEGPKAEVILERQREEKRKKKRQKNLTRMTKMFEERDHKQPDEEAADLRASVKRKQQRHDLEFKHKRSVIDKIRKPPTNTHDLVKPLIESWDWKTYEKIARDKFKGKLSVELPKPLRIDPIVVTQEACVQKVGSPQLENTVGFDSIPCLSPLTHFKEYEFMDQTLLTSMRSSMSAEKLADTANVIDKLEALEKSDIEQLPSEEELPDIVKNIKRGKLGKLASVSGLRLDINKSREVFLTGQNVSTPYGDIFVPGQTVVTPGGPLYVPGLTINTPHGISFIPGHIAENKVDGGLEFAAGQIVDDRFVPGQTFTTQNDVRFVEGQTVLDSDGKFNFIAGVVDKGAFVCGQHLQTPDGVKFIPGQTISTPEGDIFLAGQSYKNTTNGEWDFVHGQVIYTKDDHPEFVPGRTITTSEGSKFIPGYMSDDKFIPGVNSGLDSGAETFIPGLNIETKEGAKFIEGLVSDSEYGPIFMPGVVTQTTGQDFEFAVAKNMTEIVTHNPSVSGFPIDCHNMEAIHSNISVFGYMVQTSNGVEFYPSKVKEEHRPAGKAIPGRMIKQDDLTKFIPGILSEDNSDHFIPGQVVCTENGEQFVPGQVVETADGLKFVPGQVIETKNGCKFVPGQTFDSKDGPRFVPGQIVHTKAGPTFIPGQIIYTEEEGERFVPGQVVDTDDGPRFVPGRVIETADSVTFIPGQIVDTADGPRFVAPDLEDNEEGDQQFSVQSFLVSPEELHLIKPSGFAAEVTTMTDELIIDRDILRQLSEAGMTLGRQIEMSAVDLVLQSTRDNAAVQKCLNQVPENRRQNIEIFIEVLKDIVSFVQGKEMPASQKRATTKIVSVDNKFQSKVENLVKNIVSTMEAGKLSFYESMETELLKFIVENPNVGKEIVALKNDQQKVKIAHQVQNVLEVDRCYQSLCTMSMNPMRDHDDVFESLDRIINDDNLGQGLRIIANKNPEIVQQILGVFKNTAAAKVGLSVNEKSGLISQIVKDEINKVIGKEIEFLNNGSAESLRSIIIESVNLAKALEFPSDVIQLIENALELGSLQNVSQEASVQDLISRIMVIHRMLNEDCVGQKSVDSVEVLHLLRTNPFGLRSNKDFIELFRRSGFVISSLVNNNTELLELKSSKELPAQVLFNDNQLLIEDYLIKRGTKSRGALVIIKDSFKAVVPRDLSHAVLTGKCSYTLLDESGIRHFEPLNVLEALDLKTLKKVPAIKHRFSTYQQCKFATDDESNETRNTVTADQIANNDVCDGNEEINQILAKARSSISSLGGAQQRSVYMNHGLTATGEPYSLNQNLMTSHYKFRPRLPKVITSLRYF